MPSTSDNKFPCSVIRVGSVRPRVVTRCKWEITPNRLPITDYRLPITDYLSLSPYPGPPHPRVLMHHRPHFLDITDWGNHVYLYQFWKTELTGLLNPATGNNYCKFLNGLIICNLSSMICWWFKSSEYNLFPCVILFAKSINQYIGIKCRLICHTVRYGWN